GEGGNRLARFSTGKSIKPYIPDRVRDAIVKPLMFVMPKNGDLAYGYEATILVDLCDAVLNARRDDSLMPHQLHIAAQCEVLVRAFAKTGIVALVDEATGFQLYRAQDALAEILESFISEELRRWVRTFPLAYFREMCRLRNVTFNGDMRFPAYFGHLTNDVIYSRLAPGVLKELKNRTTGEYGRRKKMFQWLTDDVGHPKLLQHLGSVVTLMKLSKTWDEFMDKLNMIRPPYGDHPGLFDDLDD
ncbi:MAG: P63C domain-containing protein, partial [Planctomycetaceae bacterium]|nr:P63C domain-containing protein [Planctomycetaceae bacterium]